MRDIFVRINPSFSGFAGILALNCSPVYEIPFLPDSLQSPNWINVAWLCWDMWNKPHCFQNRMHPKWKIIMNSSMITCNILYIINASIIPCSCRETFSMTNAVHTYPNFPDNVFPFRVGIIVVVFIVVCVNERIFVTGEHSYDNDILYINKNIHCNIFPFIKYLIFYNV